MISLRVPDRRGKAASSLQGLHLAAGSSSTTTTHGKVAVVAELYADANLT